MSGDTNNVATDAEIDDARRLCTYTSTWMHQRTLVERILNRLALAEQRAERAETELLEWKQALQSLTPGGSEFADDHQYCVKVIRELRNRKNRVLIDTIQANKNLERECEWRGLLYQCSHKFGFKFQMGGDRQLWLHIPGDPWIDLGPITDTIPARPAADVVAKIKEALNG